MCTTDIAILYVTFRYCIETAQHITHFSAYDSPITLIFPVLNILINSDGVPNTGATNTCGVHKFCNFQQYLAICTERYEVGPSLLWNGNRKSHVLYQNVTFPVTLSEL